MFLAFSPEHMCSDLIRQIKTLLSLNWQVLIVLIVKFQASTLDQCHHLFINLSCISASKPLNAQYCTWARSHRGRHYECALVILYLMCTNTACSTEAEQRLCSEALTPAFYKTYAHIRSGCRCLWERNPFPAKNQTLRSYRVCISPTK